MGVDGDKGALLQPGNGGGGGGGGELGRTG